MVDSTRYADFIKTARDKIDLIKSGLLRHEKNPDDREFINDIYRSIRSIKDASLPEGLGRISELCFHLESMLALVRRNRLVINQEITELLQDGKNRLEKLIHDVETTQNERATVKDLLKRIKKIDNAVTDDETMETAPPLETVKNSAPEEKTEPDLSLLPEEIKNDDYDKELFQIFLEQMQDNLSLLRTLNRRYPEEPNKAKNVAICSDLVGKLQTSANYMGYEELADFYLQWIAELEMSSVELSIGSPVSYDYMESNLQKVTALFPQIKNISADEDLVHKVWQEFTIPVPEIKEPAIAEKSDNESFKDLFNDIGESDNIFDAESEPIAALSGVETHVDGTATAGKTKAAVKKHIKAAPVEIDGTFLEEERQSVEFDEELFQIFLQQLHENLTRIRSLLDGYSQAPNKSNVIDLCSKLVGNLQSSANYMGYKQLAEYHLQWIAELELAGVDLSIGNEVSLDFMDAKIQKIIELFPQIEGMESDVKDFSIFEQLTAQKEQPAVEKETVVQRTERSDPVNTEEENNFLSDEFEESTEESFEFDAEPIAALTDDQPVEEDLFDESAQAPERQKTATPPDEDISALFLGDELSDPTDSIPEKKTEESLEAVEEEGLFTDIADEDFDVSSVPIEAMTDEVSLPGDDKDPGDANSIEAEGKTAGEVSGDDIEALFGETDEVRSEVSDNPPNHSELLEKISDALNSLDDEPTAEESSTEHEPHRNLDNSGLFEKLLGALESTPGDVEGSEASPIDQVIEEILTGETRSGSTVTVSGTVPLQLPTPEIWHSLGLDAGKIEDLVNKIGELVASRSSLSQLHAEMSSLHHSLLAKDGLDTQKLAPLKELISRLGNTNTALGRVFGEVKDGILKVRMTPVGRLFDLYQQFVPELAHEEDKKIHFTTEGNETEIDHCSIEDIATCLLILIRNAVEHGIESSEEREESDKNPAASLNLRAYNKNNHVVLEVTDDGRGIDPAKIKAVALARNLFSGDELYTMSESDLTRLIMTPGFSTATQEMAERGPGMDILKTTVEKLNGTVQIKSSIGMGTTIRVCIPCKPPIFQALKFIDNTGSYAVPLTDIEEVLRGKKEDLVQSDGAEYILLHDEKIQVCALSDMIETAEGIAERSERFYVVIISADGRKIGLLVDSVIGPEDVSIRPLAECLKKQSGFSAAAIKGEGEISFIPDISALVKKMNLHQDVTAEGAS